jgi:hypothetical protein
LAEFIQQSKTDNNHEELFGGIYVHQNDSGHTLKELDSSIDALQQGVVFISESRSELILNCLSRTSANEILGKFAKHKQPISEFVFDYRRSQ